MPENRLYIADGGDGYSRKRSLERNPERINNRVSDYERLKSDKDYTDVEYNPQNGGLKARHIKRHKHGKKEETFFSEGLSSTQLELECQDNLYRLGHSAILMPEKVDNGDGIYLPSLDLDFDGRKMDIKSITSAKEYGNALLAKNKQLNNVFSKTGVKADSVCLYFHKSDMFSDQTMKESIDSFKKRSYDKTRMLKKVFVVVNGGDSVLEYDI